MPLEREFAYFKEHQQELVRKHEGKWLVIVGEELRGVYDTQGEAYRQAALKCEPGTFMIQQAIAGEDAYTQTFASRAVFV